MYHRDRPTIFILFYLEFTIILKYTMKGYPGHHPILSQKKQQYRHTQANTIDNATKYKQSKEKLLGVSSLQQHSMGGTNPT